MDVLWGSKAPTDNGWRIFSSIDTTEYLADTSNMQVVDYNSLCEIDAGHKVKIIDNASGRQIPLFALVVPDIASE